MLVVKSKEGASVGRSQEENQMAHLTLDKGQRVALRKLHGILGHVGEDCTRKTGAISPSSSAGVSGL